MPSVAVLNTIDSAKESTSEAALIKEDAVTNAESAPAPINRSWDTYHFDWTKAAKLFVLHSAGIFGLYLALTATDVKRATFIFTFFWHHVSGWGITVGYHRLFAHKTFDAPGWVRVVFAFLGAGLGEGSILWWSRDHRMHHKFGDTEKDPYPIVHGFWWAHMGWLMFTKNKACLEAGKKLDEEGAFDDLKAQKLVRIQHNYYSLFFLTSAYLFPIAVCSLWGEKLLYSTFIAGSIPLVLSFQGTMCVNSLAHWVGDKPYNPRISAVQNLLVAFATDGEGWHNYHHAFPMDYRASDKWYQFNPTRWCIEFLALLGLATNLRVRHGRLATDKAE